MSDTEPFPVATYKDAAQHLRRPFTPAAVKFKPQTVLGDDGKGVLCVAYIDARLVYERLNLVVPHLWHHTFRPAGEGLWCDLTIDGITRADVGEGKGKALVSDAVKRAAVTFGVGVSLYAIPQQRVWKDTQGSGGKFVSIWGSGTKQNGKPKFDARIEDAGQAHLRDVYAHWLEAIGIKAFGQPLDHGDVADAQGDPEDGHQPAAAPTPPPELTDSDVRVRDEMEDMARRLVQGDTWTTKQLGAALVAAGATDTSSVRAALRSLTPLQADELYRAMDALLPKATA